MGAVKSLYMEEIQEAEAAAFDLVTDAKFMASASQDVIWHNWEWIEEARELLNDALAKAGPDRRP